MMLADMGASVVTIDRPTPPERLASRPELDTLNRGRGSVILDLKDEEQAASARQLVGHADVLLEGFRPGVMERLGLGPDELITAHPRLIYARMTGWGQEGPMAQQAGHDINYISLTGALLAIGSEGSPPPPPLNLIGDFGGGGMLVVVGILAALLERNSSGCGQVVDAAMIDGTALLLAQVASWRAMGVWSDRRGGNVLDGGAYFYRCYACSDGGYVAVGALEEVFHDNLLRTLGLDISLFGDRLNPDNWPARCRVLEELFRSRPRDAWATIFRGEDACVTPVLSIDEAPAYSANANRQLHLDTRPASPPAPAPRFSRTPSSAGASPAEPGLGAGLETLLSWGVDARLLESIGVSVVRS
jgi:alpha-methylacyl-CoA racemase